MASPTKVHSKTTGLGGKVFDNASMLDVLRQNAGGGRYQALGRYVAAAMLNAAAGRTPYLDEGTIRQIWNDVIARGYFEPTAGVRWGAAEIVAYMQKTIA
jgi:hypothetical protein